jgi:molybdate transport system permease protein
VKTRKIPIVLWLFASIAALLVGLPLMGIFLRTPWSDLGSLIGDRTTRDALFISLQTSLVAAGVATVFGVPLAWIFARRELKGMGIIRTLCISPMVLPPVVGGIALLTAFGRRGFVGQYMYDWWGVSLPFTRSAVVLAQVFVSMPFLVVAVESAFRQIDSGLEDAARSLGASPLRVFFTVALPGARRAIIAGVALAWARAIGEFGATITFAGSFPGRTQTLPMAVYELVAVDYQQSLVLSLILVIISIAVLLGLRDKWLGGVRS